MLTQTVAGLLLWAVSSAAAPFSTEGVKTILFLGDSITHAGHYVDLFDAKLRELSGNRVPEIINMGLPSETCSGLSEPYHPFPRPDVHERLDRVLAMTKPDVVFACYGMNDGIYHPFSEERFAAYKRGVEKLIRKVKAAGATLYLITPPPFDPVPMRNSGKLVTRDAKEFGYKGIYENYNEEVLGRFAAWLLTRKAQVADVIDVRTPIMREVAKLRKRDPNLTLSGDGVHINQTGHAIFARALLEALGLDSKDTDPVLVRLVAAKHKVTHLAWLTHAGHKRPGPNSKLPFAEAMKRAAAAEAKIADYFEKR